MEIVMAVVIGVMFAAGTYMILRRSLIWIVMGFGMYSNATNLLLIVCGGEQPPPNGPRNGGRPPRGEPPAPSTTGARGAR